jgi:uncharacterized protein (DUF924 family)
MPQIETDATTEAKDRKPPTSPEAREWDEVLRFWFPDSPDEDLETHGRRSAWRMRGGADEEIVARFTDVTEQAAAGALDHWAEDPRGRLALIVILDQFSRSVWSGSPRAFAQDPRALTLALEGLENGHYAALSAPWEQTSYQLVLGHCEGPDHLARLDRAHALAQEIQASAPDHLKPIYAFGVEQKVLHRRVIETFGRYPHRNAILGRTSTPEEAAYVAEGQFPHRRAVPQGQMPDSG